MATKLYPKANKHFKNKECSWLADANIKVALLKAGYTYSENHEFISDINLAANEIAGTGYTARGAALAGKTATFYSTNSATAWAATTAYAVGDVRRPAVANGHLYICIVAGNSGGAAPAWPTVEGNTVVDGTVTWKEIGGGQHVILYDATDTSWAAATISNAVGAVVFVDTGAGADATANFLIAFEDFSAAQSSSNGTFTIVWAPEGILVDKAP